MKKLLIIIIALRLQLYTFLIAQPLPSDKGPGNPGGNLGPPLGAPIDDFVWGLIALSILYMAYKWHQLKKHSSNISN